MDSGFWSLADYERFTSLPSLGGPLLRVDEELGALELCWEGRHQM